MTLTEQTQPLQRTHDGQEGAQHATSGTAEVNVDDIERWASAIAGGALALYGVRRATPGGLALAALGGALILRGATGHCPVYSALAIKTAHPGPARPEEYFLHGIHVEEVVTVNRPPWDLYKFWRNFENLPLFMDHLESVQCIDSKRSHWVTKAPAGVRVEWDAQIINDEPNSLIAWRSLENANVDNAGSVRFIPGPDGRGTIVKVTLDYIPPAGRLGAAVARLFGEDPAAQISQDLRHFEQVMESGERPAIEGLPRGSCGA